MCHHSYTNKTDNRMVASDFSEQKIKIDKRGDF